MMKRLSIKWSLTAALALLVVMIGLISALGFYTNTTSDRALNEINNINVRLANLANRTQVNALRAQTFLDRSASFSTQGNPDKVILPSNSGHWFKRSFGLQRPLG